MAEWVSAIAPGELIIDDANYTTTALGPGAVVDGEAKEFGLVPRDFTKEPYGSNPFAGPMPSDFILPDAELIRLIREQEESKSRLSDIWHAQGYRSLDQNGTNYCWYFGPVSAVMANRAKTGAPYIPLSPASGATRVKNYRNEGGWGMQAINDLVANGVCSQEYWPQASRDSKYNTAEARANMATNKVDGWWDIPNNLRAVLSCCVRKIPCPVAYNWWSHLVCGMDGVYFGGGEFGLRILNSWGLGYGDRGFAVLRGSRAHPSDAQALISATPK